LYLELELLANVFSVEVHSRKDSSFTKKMKLAEYIDEQNDNSTREKEANKRLL
jgi:hypothetical protein